MRLSRVGTIERGKVADLQIWNVPRYEDVVYRLGGNVVETVIKNGHVSVSDHKITERESIS